MAGQRRVGPDERLSHAPVDPDVEVTDQHPRVRAFEVQLVHRDDVDDAGLKRDGDRPAYRHGDYRQERRWQGTERPARTKRSCNAGGTRQRHTGRSAHVDTAADLVTRHEGPLRLARTLKGTVEGAPPTRYSRVDTAVVSGAT